MTKRLNAKTTRRLTQLFESGEAKFDDDDFSGALKDFLEAAALLPAPVEQWNFSTALFAAIGDVHFFEGRFDAARAAFQTSMVSPDGVDNPFVHLRLGECAFELGDWPTAASELARAFSLDAEIFDGEKPAYAEFLKSKLPGLGDTTPAAPNAGPPASVESPES